MLCANTHIYKCLYVYIYIYKYLYIIYIFYIVFMYLYKYLYIGINLCFLGLSSNPRVCQIFYLFRCVLSSLLPLQNVGRSNFDRGLHNLVMLIKKRHGN